LILVVTFSSLFFLLPLHAAARIGDANTVLLVVGSIALAFVTIITCLAFSNVNHILLVEGSITLAFVNHSLPFPLLSNTPFYFLSFPSYVLISCALAAASVSPASPTLHYSTVTHSSLLSFLL
jgi:hypothetical protein